MVFENIELLQRQLTDKFVVVDAARPELKRFDGMTGVVKTVNFSGRALVEFDANNNIGWFDIDPRFLKVIDAPLAKPAAKETKAEKKAAPAKVEKPAAVAAKPAAAKPAASGSVADILAAARGGAKPAAPAAAKPASASTADILAAARAKAAPAPQATTATPVSAASPAVETPAAETPTVGTPAKVDPKKLSVAEMLAMARGQKAAAPGVAETPQAAPPRPAAPPPAPVVSEAPPAAPEPEPAAEVQEPSAAAEAGGVPKLDRNSMDIPAMLAYCRRVDAKG